MSETKPWAVDPKVATRVVNGDGKTVATTGTDSTMQNLWAKHAAQIVQAVNSFDSLVKALEAITKVLADNPQGPRLKEKRKLRDEEIQAAWEQGLAALTAARKKV